MPEPSWESSNNDWSYGYLKFLDFQSQGFDVHVTFPTSKKDIHASIYVLGNTSEKKTPPGNVSLTIQDQGLTITDHNMNRIMIATGSQSLPTVTGYTSYKDFFLQHSNAKALELGIISEKPKRPGYARGGMLDFVVPDDAGRPGYVRRGVAAQHTKPLSHAARSSAPAGC